MKSALLYPYRLLLFSLVILSAYNTHAAHLTGGDMTYRCIGTAPNGDRILEFSLYIYRDDLTGGAPFDDPVNISYYNLDFPLITQNANNFSVSLQAQNVSTIPLNDLGPCARNVPVVRINKALYTFQLRLPINNRGYRIVHQRCCRPGNITNVRNPGSAGSTYFIDVTRTALQNCNSSPIFLEDPPILLCSNALFEYRFTGFDADNDSLVYSLCQPFLGGSQNNPSPRTMATGPYTAVNYNNGFSFTSPLGQNSPVSIDPETGVLTTRPRNVGIYTVGVCIDEYRNGVLKSNIRRDIQFNVADCVIPEASATVPVAEPLPGVFASCKGQTLQFRNNSQDAQTNFWDFGVAGTDSDTSNLREPTFTFPDSGSYNITLIINKGQLCADTSKITVRVFPNLDANFTEDAKCPFVPVQFTDLSTSTADPITSWTWRFGNGTTSNERNPVLNYGMDGTFPVSLLVETSLGCKDSIQKTIVLPDVPEGSFTIQSALPSGQDTLTICTSGQVNFINQSPIGVSNNWSFGVPGGNSTDRDPSFTFPDSGTYKIMLIVEAGTTCADTTIKYLRVLPSLSPDFSFSNECVKAPVFFTKNIVTPYDPIRTVTWNFGDGTTSTQENPEKIYANSGNFNVRMTIRTTVGCQAQITKSVSILPIPIANFTPQGIAAANGNFIRCENNLSIRFDNQSTQNNTNLWSFGIAGATSTAASPSFTYPQTGNFNVSLIINPGEICSDTLVRQIRVVNGLSTANFNAPNACVNTNIRFANQTTSPINDISIYRWNFGDGTTSSVRNPDKIYTTPGIYQVKLYLETAQGCKDSITKSIEIYPAPRPLYDVSQACLNAPVLIVNNSTISSGQISTYNWSFGNGSTSNSTTPTVTYSTPGIYQVSLQAISDQSCSAILNDSIRIFLPSTVNFGYSNQCVNAPVFFTDSTLSPYNNIVKWNWDFGNGLSSTTRNPSLTFPQPGNFPVKFSVESAQGCKDSTTKTITIKPVPIADFTIDGVSGGPGIFIKCEDNFTVNFTNLSTDNATNFWNFGVPGATSFSADPTFIYPDTGFYTVKLSINTGTFCEDTVAYRIRTLPALTLAFNVVDTCVINNLSFANQSTSALNDINFVSWSFGDGSSSSTFSPQHKYALAGKYDATLILGTSKGCLDTLTKSVRVHPMPVANFVAEEACPRQNTRIRNTTTISSGNIANYAWDLGNGNQSTAPNPTTVYPSPGNFSIQLIATSNFGCRDTMDDVILVRDFVVPNIVQSFDEYCINEPIFFSSENSLGIYGSVLWDFGNGQSSILPSDSVIYRSPGDYIVELTLSDSLCGSFDTTALVKIIGIPNINLGQDFSLCPTLSTTLNIGNAVYDTVLWSTGVKDINQITVNGDAGTVKVEVFEKGCYTLDSVVITPSCDVLAPSVFTPNGDGVNDLFNLIDSNVESFTLQVYNRWGQLVYSTNQLNGGWDGTFKGVAQPMDNYTFYSSGIRTDGKAFSLSGAVLLIR